MRCQVARSRAEDPPERRKFTRHQRIEPRLICLTDHYVGSAGDQVQREFRQAATQHPDQIQQIQNLSGGGGSSLNDTSFINKFADALSHPFKVGFAESMTVVFYCGAAVMVIGLLVIVFLPALPLRSMSAAQQRAQEEADEAADEPADEPALPPLAH